MSIRRIADTARRSALQSANPSVGAVSRPGWDDLFALGRALLRGLLLALLPLSAAAGTAITGATVYTLEGDEPIENATVLIDQGRIQAVGSGIAVPEGYEQLDARGRIVTPGFIESHSQLGLVEISGEYTTVDAQVGLATVEANQQPYRLGPAFDIQHAINPASTLLPVNRMEGVTRAVVAPWPGHDPLSGWGAAIRLGEDDVLTQPGLALFGHIGAGSAMYVGGSRSAVIQRLRFALEDARDFRASRYRPGTMDYSRHDMEALQAFLDSGAPLVITVQRANEILEALAIGRDFDVPVIIHGGAEAWQVAEELAAARVPVIVDALDNLPVTYDQLGARLDNAALLHQAGVQVLFTAEDSHNARLLRQVAGNAVAEGMPWAVALAAVTRVPGRTFGLEPGAGTLAEGAPADLVIWTGDPLEITNWAERVMIDGEWVPMESRQTRLLERYRDLEGDTPFGYR